MTRLVSFSFFFFKPFFLKRINLQKGYSYLGLGTFRYFIDALLNKAFNGTDLNQALSSLQVT